MVLALPSSPALARDDGGGYSVHHPHRHHHHRHHRAPEFGRRGGSPVSHQRYPITAEVTGYSWGCGATQRTASGVWPYVGGTAADKYEFPFGTTVVIPGLWTVRVNDTGSGVGRDHFDVFFPDCRQAIIWGRRWETVYVYP